MGLINRFQRSLAAYARFQQKHTFVMVSLVILVTLILGSGIARVSVESDFEKMNPGNLPVTSLDKETRKVYGDYQGILILISLDASLDERSIQDIRDPKVLSFLLRLDELLKKEDIVVSSTSLANIFSQTGEPESIEEAKAILSSVPGSSSLISKDYTFTTIFISANVGTATEQLDKANARIAELINEASPPAGITAVVTGDPALGAALFNLLISDAFKVLIYATVIIFFLLAFTERSLKRAFLLLIPLLLGLTWSLGWLGWLDIPITVGTAGLSAMLLGLGVEYTIFLYARYKEERRKDSVSKALEHALENVGASIFSSGGTTVIGFFALALSIFPILSGLGKSLGIGILMLLSSTIFVLPLIITLEDKWVTRFSGQKIHKASQVREQHRVQKEPKINHVYRAYAQKVSHYPLIVFLLSLAFTGLMVYGIGQIKQTDFNHRTVLPEDMPELKAFTLLENERGESSSAKILVRIEDSTLGVEDVRDPIVLEYLDLLEQKLFRASYVTESDSLSGRLKSIHSGRLPSSLLESKKSFDMILSYDIVSKDYSSTILRLNFDDRADEDREDLFREINDILESSSPPEGVSVYLIGDLGVNVEQNAVVGKDSAITSLIAFAVIIIFLYLLSRSFKDTFMPLVTVIVGIFWTLGLVGVLGVPYNSITSSVITMTIGVGIDFGLQLLGRFRYEQRSFQKRKAMEHALVGVLTPMLLTVLAALIGFRAMNFGELSLMADLGVTMSIAIVSCFLASITAVASLIVLVTKDAKK